jgi:hypothetical protein
LLKGHLASSIRTGPDNVDDGFGPRQINSSIEESPEGKFPGACQTRTGLKKEIENTAHYKGSAMAMNLDNIFPGVGPGGAHDDGHDLVDQHSFMIEKSAVN